MGVQVAGTSSQWSQLLASHAPSSSQASASASASAVISSLCSKRKGSLGGWATHHIAGHYRSSFLCAGSAKLSGTGSFDEPKGIRRRALDPSCSSPPAPSPPVNMSSSSSLRRASEPSAEPPWPFVWPEPAPWPECDAIVPASVERNANTVGLPLSLRIIKRKKQQRQREEEEFFMATGGSAWSAVKKAFSSMVFIVRELLSFALQVLVEDLQGILARVQHEVHASFVWLFQHIFSCTPTLMVSVMLLLANFTVYSMDHHAALAATAAKPCPPHHSVVAVTQSQLPPQQIIFESSQSVLKTLSVGGIGGGKARPVAGATDDGRSDGPHALAILPEGTSAAPATEEEAVVWNRLVEEAEVMQAGTRDEALMDSDMLHKLVAPVTPELEPEDRSDYLQTELKYQQALSREPDNALLLTNFAQFLYLVLHDHDRAEYYFKRAVEIKPVDAESLSWYAGFLWAARKDLAAAEETYLEAIAADPGNAVYAANYAHFLWSTGGEDTCYPLDGPDEYGNSNCKQEE